MFYVVRTFSCCKTTVLESQFAYCRNVFEKYLKNMIFFSKKIIENKKYKYKLTACFLGSQEWHSKINI